MSDNEQELPAESATETAAQLEDRSAERSSAKKSAKRKAIAWLVVLLVLIAMAIVGYTAFEDWRNADDSGEIDNQTSLENLSEQLAQSNIAIAALEARLEQDKPQDLSAAIDALRADIDERVQLIGSLPTRMSALENSVASLAGISAGARETFLLAEAEYYLQIANAQLQLANNPELASLALHMADERVTQLSNPALIEVRRALADELAALEAMEKPDLVGATLTLASLARVVESLPLANTAQADAGTTDEADQGGAWQSVKDAMGGLVKVTPPEQAKLALLSPDAEYFLRNNIAMQLQAARLALLRGEQAIFEQALDDTSTLLDTYFDGNSPRVSSAQQTIGEIRTSIFTAAPPDISESLRLLRQFMTLRETTG